MQELNIKRWMESEAYEKQKAVIRKEINQHQIHIDYSVFKKSPAEKMQAYSAKMQWKELQRGLRAA